MVAYQLYVINMDFRPNLPVLTHFWAEIRLFSPKSIYFTPLLGENSCAVAGKTLSLQKKNKGYDGEIDWS
jgi:hypothetical protein